MPILRAETALRAVLEGLGLYQAGDYSQVAPGRFCLLAPCFVLE